MKKILLIIIIGVLAYFAYQQFARNDVQEAQLQQGEEELQEQEEQEEQEELEEVDEIPETAPEGSFVVDPQQSVVTWYGTKPGGSHTGDIEFQNGYLTSDYQGRFAVQMSSITSDVDGLTDHLKSQDFFDVINYPQAEFTATGYVDGKLTGELEILGVSRDVSIPAEITIDGDTMTIDAQYTIDRTSFGITIRSGSFFENLGDRLIGDAVEVEARIVAARS